MNHENAPKNLPDKIVQQFNQQLIKNITKSNSVISFTLESKELGEIGIKVNFAQKSVVITTDYEQAKNILQENVHTLEGNLNDAGIENMSFNFKSNNNAPKQGQHNKSLDYDCVLASEGKEENSTDLLNILV